MDFARLIAGRYIDAHAVNSDYKAYAQKIAYSPYISEGNGDNRENYRKGIINAVRDHSGGGEKKGIVTASTGISITGGIASLPGGPIPL
jgi:hypothetical protein